MEQIKDLTSTNTTRTFTIEPMDATTKTLLKKLRELENARWKVDSQIRAIRTALTIAGVRPGNYLSLPTEHEGEYSSGRPFSKMLLAESCEKILKDQKGGWLTKSQVEYLLARGGYESQAKDSKNSIDVTLRRLAEAGKCEAERVRGARGNKYRIAPPNPQGEQVKEG